MRVYCKYDLDADTLSTLAAVRALGGLLSVKEHRAVSCKVLGCRG